MKRKLTIFAIVLLSILISTVAYGETKKTTGYVNNISLYAGRDSETSPVSLISETTPIKGKDCSMQFSRISGGQLPGTFASDSSRIMWTYLREYDPDPNLPETVKTYKTTFSGRTYSEFTVYKKNTDGNIEGSNDNVGEFYAVFHLNKCSGDKVITVPAGSLFQYKITVK